VFLYLILKIKNMIHKKCATFMAAFLICFNLNISAQFTVSGQVKTPQGENVPFAVIGIQKSQTAVIADAEGEFELSGLKSGTYILVFTCLGYIGKTDTLSLNSNLRIYPVLNSSSKQLEEAVVKASRVDKGSGMAFSNVDAETLKKQNLGQDAPYMLNLLPSVVVNSDAGNGIGYTGLRIRGTDGTRINVTVNGVPVNDAESQGTYFVNMPDFISSVDNIQVQRGVGTSLNGAGAFGGSINFQTNQLKTKPYAQVISSAGTFSTYRNTLAVGTGLLNNNFALDARASYIKSEGYIDRASSDLRSYFLSAAYYANKTVFKFINFNGKEKTYQAWNYVPQDSLNAGNRTYNSCGEYTDANGNVQYYSDETDNYQQNNFQFHVIHQFNSRLNLNVTAHYTKGKGYYEQYRQGSLFSDYNLNNIITDKQDTLSETDLVRRLWLNNDFAGGIFNLYYTLNTKIDFTLGGGFNTYFGQHYGTVVWAQYASNATKDYQYYKNTANKNDGNLYLKTNIKPSEAWNVFVDLQLRKLDYDFLGFNDSLKSQMQNQSYTFFNPKLGLSFDLNSKLNCYASVAMANKEPNRNDFIQSSPSSRPRPEQLIDLEAGLKYTNKKLTLNINLFNMQYKNQLVLNGEINDVGAYNRINVESSFRRGIELEVNAGFNKYLDLGANLTLSNNKIKNFSEYTDSSDVDYTIYVQSKKTYSNTDISFSPRVVSSLILIIKPISGLEISIINKYVSRQFLDNTSNSENNFLQLNNQINTRRSIKPYYVLDARINYTLKTKVIPEIGFMLSVYNVLSTAYETNGYTYSYYTGATLNTFNFLAPASPVYFLAGLSLKF
jgi:iron complex outermembrane recepter protein